MNMDPHAHQQTLHLRAAALIDQLKEAGQAERVEAIERVKYRIYLSDDPTAPRQFP